MTIDITTRNLLISLSSHMAYMQGQLEALHQLDDPDDHYWFRESVALQQKVADHLAALADEPAVPAPTVMEIIELSEEAEAAGLGQVDFAHDLLARRGNPAPQPPADGEVAELVRTMRMEVAAWNDNESATYWLSGPEMARAAELLERLSPPQPVPVSERLPGQEDCDAEGRCWWGTPSFVNCYSVTQSAQWRLSAPDDRFGSEVFWRPAHALPVPEVGE